MCRKAQKLDEMTRVIDLARKTRDLAHRRVLGSMDPLWDCVSRLETYPDIGGIDIGDLISDAEEWLKKENN